MLKNVFFSCIVIFLSSSISASPYYLIFLGAPGSGKSTQTSLLEQKRHMSHICVGDLLRKEVASGSQIGNNIKKYMDQGQMVPEGLALGLLWKELKNKSCEQGCILDGTSRSLSQAKMLIKHLPKEANIVAVFLSVPSQEIIHRIQNRVHCAGCGKTYNLLVAPSLKAGICDVCNKLLVRRTDDKNPIIIRRLYVYKKNEQEVLSFYKNINILVEVDGHRSVPVVAEKIEKIIQNFGV